MGKGKGTGSGEGEGEGEGGRGGGKEVVLLERCTHKTIIGGSCHKYHFCLDKYLSRQT